VQSHEKCWLDRPVGRQYMKETHACKNIRKENERCKSKKAGEGKNSDIEKRKKK
jgi:hypothetical protein